MRFREILREIDDEIGEEELDGIISDVSLKWLEKIMILLLQIDSDHSETIDFNEFVKIMT